MRQENEISRSLKIYYPGFRVEPERFHATLYAALLTISDAPLPVFPVYLLSPKDMLNKQDLLLEELSEQKEIRKTHLGKEYSICTAARPYFGRRSQVFTG